jgi:hypothetical protein
MSDGALGISSKSIFNRQIISLDFLNKSILHKFVFRDAEYNSEIISLSTMSSFCISPKKYDPKFADYLAEGLTKIFSE